MNFILIDAGNSRLKLSITPKHAENVTEYQIIDYDNLIDGLHAALQDVHPDVILLSSVNNRLVSNTIFDLAHQLWNIEPVELIAERENYGITTRYNNPRTLGSDRWAALIAARAEFKQNLCIVDCGTAVTVDVLTSEGMHLGGLIAPGIVLSKKALGANTARLGDYNLVKAPESRLLATNTADAVIGGVLFQSGAFIDRILSDLKDEFGQNMICILTGGDAKLMQTLSIHEIHYRETLVLDGLLIVARKNYGNLKNSSEIIA